MWACYGGNYDIVKLLVQHNEDSVSIKSEKVYNSKPNSY